MRSAVDALLRFAHAHLLYALMRWVHDKTALLMMADSTHIACMDAHAISPASPALAAYTTHSAAHRTAAGTGVAMAAGSRASSGRVTVRRPSVRVLVIPGLRDSGETHWQTWLQAQYRDAVRVEQQDWEKPDLVTWSQRISETIGRYSAQTQWVAVAHSFGTLALAHHLDQARSQTSQGIGPSRGRVMAALMAAPADPLKFGVASQLPGHGLGLPLTVIGSETDPWMPLDSAREWAHRWGGSFVNLGDVGHINTESGFGPWPLARHKVDQLIRQQLGAQPCLCQLADNSHFP